MTNFLNDPPNESLREKMYMCLSIVKQATWVYAIFLNESVQDHSVLYKGTGSVAGEGKIIRASRMPSLHSGCPRIDSWIPNG